MAAKSVGTEATVSGGESHGPSLTKLIRPGQVWHHSEAPRKQGPRGRGEQHKPHAVEEACALCAVRVSVLVA